MKKGILILRDPALQEIVSNLFSDWVVFVSFEAKQDIAFYPLPL